ncbi:MAG: hypothetical protein ACT4P5_20140 [Armatimonadota bacterium]
MTARHVTTVRRIATALVLASIAVGVRVPPGSGQPATPGMSQTPGVTQLGLISPDQTTFAPARSAGVRAVKILADWNAIEAQRGAPSWADLDRAVAGAVREGLAPIVVLAYTPRWASIGTGADLTRAEIYSRQPPRDLKDWERFVDTAAGRFRGRVSQWQVWTQLGLPHFRGTGSEYLALLQTARARLRASDPAARVVMAAPTGVDLGFLVRVAQEASGAFDVITLTPQGFSPESLLRPLAVLGQRVRSAGKALWLDWNPDGAAVPADRSAGFWARLLVVSQATGIERLFAGDPSRLAGELRQAAAVLAGRPYAGYLVRDPDVYALVFGTGPDAVLLGWATAEGRVLELPGAQGLKVTTVDGQPAPVEVRDGRGIVRLGLTPVVASGFPAALVDEARTTAANRGPLVPIVTPDRDYSRQTEVSARLARVGEERGLYNLPYRSRSNGAVEPVEIGGVEAVQTSVTRQVIYVYFDIDDTFLYFVEGRVAVEITVEVRGARADRQVGFNLLYDSTGGYRFTPWQWIDARDGWVSYTIRLTDANMANTWGWDFAINTAGNRAEDLIVRSVTVRKAANS